MCLTTLNSVEASEGGFSVRSDGRDLVHGESHLAVAPSCEIGCRMWMFCKDEV